MEKSSAHLNAFTLPSPAKVNRFLHIIGRRADGYHLLQTLCQFLDFGDKLHFTTREDNLIVLSPDPMLDVPQEKNLIYLAALALQQTANINRGVTIHIEKHIPLGAGLGGGSSNAATTLFALNELWQLHWSLPQLAQLGLSLGADIPCFLFGHTAWGEGVGEQLTAIEADEPWLVVISPPCQVPTAKMYGDPDLTRNTPTLKIEALTKGKTKLAKSNMSQTISELKNDFEPLVRRHYPEINDAMTWLSNYGRAYLSGSGASVFSCFDSLEQAKETLQRLPQRFKGFIAKARNISELKLVAESLGFKNKDWGVAKR